MKNLVVYYTMTGNTEVAAKEIQKLTGADIRKIEEKKQRQPGKLMGPAFAAFISLRSRLKPMDYSLKEYENVFLCAQVWAAHSTPAINTYLGRTVFKNKNVFLLLTKADEKVPQTVIDSITKRIEKRGGKVIDSFSITTKMNEIITPEAVSGPITEWIKKSGIIGE